MTDFNPDMLAPGWRRGTTLYAIDPTQCEEKIVFHHFVTPTLFIAQDGYTYCVSDYQAEPFKPDWKRGDTLMHEPSGEIYTFVEFNEIGKFTAINSSGYKYKNYKYSDDWFELIVSNKKPTKPDWKRGDLLQSTADKGLTVQFIKWTPSGFSGHVVASIERWYGSDGFSYEWNPAVFYRIDDKPAKMQSHMTKAQIEEAVMLWLAVEEIKATKINVPDDMEISYET